MKKVLYTLALDGYPHEMTDLTFPWLKFYANKIGAEFQVIKERRFPDYPATYEKHQIFKLGQDNDWSVFIDADALINPELFDVTALCPRDTVLFTGQDMSAMRFRPNKYSLRDGRYIGACTWFVVCSDWTLDLWRPSDDPLEQIFKNIFPSNQERTCMVGDGSKHITPDKLIEDYTTSQNIARFGLKHLTIEGHLKQALGRPHDAYYWHQYTAPIDEKIIQCLGVMAQWGLLTKEISEKFGPLLQKLQAQKAGKPC